MKRMSRSIFSALLLLLALGSAAQDAQKPKKDTAKPVTMMVPAGLRLGLDISRLAVHYFQPYRTDVTVNLDARYNDRLYFASDLSYNRTAHEDENYTYRSSGFAVTLGANYNFLKKQVPKENFMIYGGARYGLAVYSYEVPEYHVASEYWGNYTGSVPKTSQLAHWFELTVGIKVEVLKNFYLGWSLHERLLISRNVSKQDFPPLVIPGYGKGYKNNSFDMQYSVAYLIPLYKVKQAVKL
ncbi:DUF6048 family protein [Chitinophaga alhagiae]|nr:DUF6048 family protein [Chitinophaga alhagiae]